jgi:hypothetical protein
MVTSDDPYAYMVAKILHLSLPFCSLPSLFLSALPAHGKGVLLDEMGDGSSIPCAGILCVCVCVCVFCVSSCSDLKERLLSLTHAHAYIIWFK